MVCNIWGFHGGDYEECLLLGYKNPVHTSQETNYFTARDHLVTANDVPSAPIIVTLMMDALGSYETSVLTRATRRNISVNDILHSHCREHFKSYISLTGWTL
jgi:hypothetical protein